MRISAELRDRTKAYAAGVIRLYAEIPHSQREVEVLGHQLLRSGTSVAANLREASRARSDAEFISKCEIALQEADEAQLWLELLTEECGVGSRQATDLLNEAGELIAILVTIVSKVRRARQGKS